MQFEPEDRHNAVYVLDGTYFSWLATSVSVLVLDTLEDEFTFENFVAAVAAKLGVEDIYVVLELLKLVLGLGEFVFFLVANLGKLFHEH
jgi:hypothetical protein